MVRRLCKFGVGRADMEWAKSAMNKHVDRSALADPGWKLSPDDFNKIAQFARANFGLALSPSKKSLIQSRLTRRMNALKLVRFSDYLERLNGPDGALEVQELLSVLTTNITHFFREDHHYDLLRHKVLPPLIKRARAGGRVRLWSAGCSTGQEAYSMAMQVLDQCPEAATLDFKILATDIDPVVIKQAAKGVYTAADLEPVPDAYKGSFVTHSREDADLYSMKDSLKALVTFRVLNLIDPFPVRGPFDVIFCRNVTIYFDRETQAHVWGQLCAVLGQGGYLFIGHSERISGPYETQMQRDGFTSFVKV